MKAFNQGNKICITPEGNDWAETVETETPGRAEAAAKGERIIIPDLDLSQGAASEANAQ